MGFSYSSKLGDGTGIGDDGFSYNPATDTSTFGTISANNLTATALATPVITPPVSPVLSLETTITVISGLDLGDGEFFTLSDGSAVVYEFTTDGTYTAGRVPIAFVGGETAQAIRDLVVVAINGSTLQATAIAAAADTLTVTSDVAGDTMGVNSKNVGDTGFLVPAWSEPTHVTTYGYKVVAYLADGTSTAASAEVTTAAGHATLSAANYNAVTWGNVTGATEYRLYRTTGGTAPPRLLYTGTATSYVDTGAAGTAQTPATGNTTGRVLVGDGSAAAPSVAFASDPTSGWSRPGGSTWDLNLAGALHFRFGVNSFRIASDIGKIGLGAAEDTILFRAAAATLQLGAANAASPIAQTLKVQDATGSNANGAASFTVKGPAGRGTGTRGIIDFQAAQAAASGDNAQTHASRLKIKELTVALPSLPVYADNTAALAGSLVAGDVYRTSTGVLMVTY